MSNFLRLAVALAALAFSQSVLRAVDDVQVGATGANGASATATAVSADATNFASATGGNSTSDTGTAGNAVATSNTTYAGSAASNSRATSRGGDNTNFNYSGTTTYPGGSASASASGTSASASSLDIVATSTGGQGSISGNGPGGVGGNATVAASGSLQSGGVLTVSADALSGPGGNGQQFSISGNGGMAGSVTVGLIEGISLGDATVSLKARAGAGGSFAPPGGSNFPARGADGRSVTLNNAVQGSAGGTLRLVQEAVAGSAGITARGSGLPVAGIATSLLDRQVAAGTALLQVETKATGGQGSILSGSGGAIFDRSPGGLGTATARARNDGGRAVAIALGNGGPAYPSAGTAGNGGPGAASSTADSQTTAAGAGASATATATGTAGTSGSSGFAGAGGRADADATAHTTGDGSTSATASATGGETHPTGFGNPPPGGQATATATGTATGAAPLTVSATATGGNGGPTSVTTSNPGGTATAQATGSTLGTAQILARADAGRSGFNVPLGLATATGNASGGTLTANASTGRLFTIDTRAVSGRAIAVTVPLGSTASARAALNAGTLSFDPQTAPQAFAAVNVGPAPGAVTAVLSGNTTSAARFDPNASSQRLLLGTAGAKAPAGVTGPVTTSCQLTSATASNTYAIAERKNLLLALLNPRLTGNGVDSVRLRVVSEGSTVHDVTLSGSNAARAYFTDRVLDFGPIAATVSGDLDVDILLDVTSSQPDGGFFADFYLANATPATVQTVDQWRSTYFGPGAINSGSAADDANPTGDGYSNLLKYALGWNPLLAYPPGAGVVVDLAAGHLRLTVERSPSISGIALVVEGTGDLSPASLWTTTGLTIQQNTATLLQVVDDALIEPGNRRMLRLRATRM